MPSEDSARIDRAVADLRPQGPRRPPLRAVCTLDDRMRELCTPGVSVAVIENFEVAWARGFGVRGSLPTRLRLGRLKDKFINELNPGFRQEHLLLGASSRYRGS